MKKLIFIIFLSSIFHVNAQEVVTHKECVETEFNFKKVEMLVSDHNSGIVFALTGYVAFPKGMLIMKTAFPNDVMLYPDSTDYRDIDFKKLSKNYSVWVCRYVE